MKKGFISLEYILLFASLLVIFSVFVLTINNLYQKNLDAIDNKNLLYFKTTLQDVISFQELQTTSLEKIFVSPNDCWIITNISNKEITIKNNYKEYNIYSKNIFINKNIDVCNNSFLFIKTKDNKIDLYLE